VLRSFRRDAAAVQVVELVAALGGTATRAQLTGVRRGELEAAVRDGSVTRLARGVYALPDAPAPVRVAAALRGVLSHTSAAQHWSLDLVATPDRQHVTVARNRSGLDGGPEVHLHWADLPAHDVRAGATSPLRTVLDCARTLPFTQALAVADSALRRRLVTADELLVRARATQGAGRDAVLDVARAADGRAANAFESALRAVVLVAGPTGFRPQVLLRGHGFAARVDLGDPRRRIALEADSFAWHGDRAALARDCRRYDELVARGWLVLRFAWEQVVFEPVWVGRTVRATCRLRDRELAALRPRRRLSSMQKSA
jgi:very-short-patch-repair endonuclease